MTDQQLRREIFQLAWPIVLSNLLQRGVGIVDTLLVGHVGANELAAVGLCQVLIMVAVALLYAVGTGTNVLVAFHTGANEIKQRREVANTSLWVGFVLSILISLVGYQLSATGARVMGGTGTVVELAVTYLSITWIFFIFKAYINILSNIFQGTGDTRTPLWVIIGVNVLHVLIAYPLIFGVWGFPRWGVRGAALASGISEALGALVLLAIAIQRKLVASHFVWYRKEDVRRLVSVGSPVAGERLLIQSMQIVYARLLLGFSVATYAAHQIGLAIESFSFLPGLGFSQAATTLVGQNIGARDFKRASRSGYQSQIIALVFMSILGALFIIFPHFWVSLFTRDPEVIGLGRRLCIILGILQPILAVAMVFSGALRGAGETKFVMYATFTGAWLVRLPFAYLLGIQAGLGLLWVWIAMPVDWAVRALIVWWRYRKVRWASARGGLAAEVERVTAAK